MLEHRRTDFIAFLLPLRDNENALIDMYSILYLTDSGNAQNLLFQGIYEINRLKQSIHQQHILRNP